METVDGCYLIGLQCITIILRLGGAMKSCGAVIIENESVELESI